MACVLFAPIFEIPFIVESEYSIPPDFIGGHFKCTYWSYCTIDFKGEQIAFIDDGEIKTFNLSDKDETKIVPQSKFDIISKKYPGEIFDYPGQTIIRKDRGAHGVLTPIAVCYQTNGFLMVSDLGKRRVSVFSPDNSLYYSFFIVGSAHTPNEMRMMPDGRYLLGGLILDTSKALNAGYHCSFYSEEGIFLNSFAYTPQFAFDNNLWVGVSVLLDIDDSGYIYCAFSVESKIYRYSDEGILLDSFGVNSSRFVPPPALPMSRFSHQVEPRDFWRSWTRIIKLIYAGDGKLVLAYLNNDLNAEVASPFLLDIYSTDGKLIVSGIQSDAFPIGRDKDNYIYMLSFDGDRLYKTYLDGYRR
jgi:hypothetical protein